jgi:hypothetical protein
MKTPYTKGQVIRPFEMPEKLLQVYQMRMRNFNKKPREGIKYIESKDVHYYKVLDKGCETTFCLMEDVEEEKGANNATK